MAIRIVCECGFVGSVRDEYAGRRVKCTRCGLLTVATPAGTEFGGARPLAGESWDSVAPASEGAGGEEEAFWWDETAGVWRGGDEEAGALRQADWAAGPVRQSHLFNESARRGVTAKYRSGAERRAAAVGELSAGDKSLFRVSLIALLVLGAVLVVWQCVEMGPSVGPLVAGVLLLAAFAGMAILAWRWHSVGIGALFSGAIWGAFAAVAGLLYTVGRGVEPLWPSLLLGVGALTACLLCLGLLARRGVWQAMSHLGNMALIPWLVFGGVLCPLTYAGVMAVRVPTEQVVQGQTRAAKAQALKVADIKECDRRMQKIVEARAKYLETHGGVAAETLSELVAAGLLEEQETVCPAAERRLGGESAEARYEFFAYDKLSSANHHRALDETGGLIVLHRTADEHDDKGYAGHTAGGRRLQLSKQQRDEVFESREQSLPSLRCRNNLLKIYGALVQYAETHQGSLPDDLSVLVQEKLVAAETLRCPVLAAKHATGKEGSSSGRHVGGRESARAEPDKQIGLLSSSSDYWYIGSKYSLELIRKEAGGELAIVADACEPTAHRGNVYSLTARGQLRTEINSSRFTLWKQSLVGMNGAQCRENLKLLRDGLVAYAANHDGCLPVELSDLVKEGLVTEQALRCPALAAAGKVSGDTSDYFFLRDKYPLSAYVNQNAFLVSDGPEAYRVHGSFFGAVKVGSLVEDVRHTDFATFVSSTEQKLINELCKANLRRIHAALAQYAYRHRGQMPAELSQLVTDGLLEASALRCPVLAATGRQVEGMSDYLYAGNEYLWDLHTGRNSSTRVVADSQESAAAHGNWAHVINSKGEVTRHGSGELPRLFDPRMNKPPYLQPRTASLLRLRMALLAYAAGHEGKLPADLGALVEAGLADAGQLRLPNSADGEEACQYLYLGNEHDLDVLLKMGQTTALLAENPSRGADYARGDVSLWITMDGTVGQKRGDWSTRVQEDRGRLNDKICETNLRAIHQAIIVYAKRNGGLMPRDLRELVAARLIGTEQLYCPAALKKLAASAGTGEVDRDAAMYTYTGRRAPLIRAQRPDYVLLIDHHPRFIPARRAEESYMAIRGDGLMHAVRPGEVVRVVHQAQAKLDELKDGE